MNSDHPNTSGVVVPPPVLYLCTFLTGSIIQIVYPLKLSDSTSISLLIASCLFIPSVVFARWAFITMRHAGTSASHSKPSASLSIHGPYRFSRNPIYVAMTGIYLGAVFLVNAVWPLLLLIPLLIFMHWFVIVKEERYLTQKFGQTYFEYKSNVRRWL